MTDLGYCRLCAEIKKCSTFKVINKNEYDFSTSLCYKISQCFQIQILSDDNLPKTVCLDCCTQTNITYEFYQKVHRAQEILRNITFNSEINKSSTGFQYLSDELNLKNETANHNIKNEISAELFDDNSLSPASEPFNSREDIQELELKTENDQKATDNTKKTSGRKPTKQSIDIWKDYKWPCSKCENEFGTRQDLTSHFEDVHSEPPEYKCPECSKCYPKYKTFTQHFRKHRNYQKFRCHLCDKAFNDSAYLRTHLNLFHEQIPIVKKVCQVCGKDFKTSTSLKYHMKCVHEISKYECDICHRKLTTKSSLQEHKKTHDESTKTHICDQCGLGFRLKNSLRYHIENIHEGIKEENYLQCPLCPKKFKHRIRLQRHHHQVHLDKKRFECETCSKKFYLRKDYVTHVRLHTGERPFECQYCKKCFRQKTKLTIHIRQHTGEKPYKCTDCNHDFTDLSNYIKHMRGKHGVTSFKNVKKFS